MSKSPAYQCYPKDLLSDLRCVALPNNQYGMYRKLLDHCWLENGLPDDPAVLAKAVGEPVRAFTEKHWPVLRPFFDVRADGRLTQKRQEAEREKQRRWSEKSAAGGRKGAATRAQAAGNHPSTTVDEPLQPNGNIAFASPFPFPSPREEPSQVPPEPTSGPPPVAVRAVRANGRPEKAEAKSAATWSAYAAAYTERYRSPPVRNPKVNGCLARLVDLLGAEEAPAVAAWYVGSNLALYVRAGHPVELLVRDAEKLRTEWATGRTVTETQARQGDRRETTRQWADELLAENRARRAQEVDDGDPE